jgi:hypothetical protein
VSLLSTEVAICFFVGSPPAQAVAPDSESGSMTSGAAERWHGGQRGGIVEVAGPVDAGQSEGLPALHVRSHCDPSV